MRVGPLAGRLMVPLVMFREMISGWSFLWGMICFLGLIRMMIKFGKRFTLVVSDDMEAF